MDGDLYFIAWDDRLLPPTIMQSFDYQPPPIKSKDRIVEDGEMLDFFIDFMNYESLGKVDNSHLALADESANLASDPKCLKLAEFHASAVDFAKTGYTPPVDSRYLAK